MDDVPGSLVAGAVATATITVLLFLGDAATRASLRPFERLGEFVGAGGLAGFAVFAVVGVVAWPLLYLSFLEFIPGDTAAARGVLFGVVLWVGFVTAFLPSGSWPTILVFDALALVAHLGYGFALGSVFGRLADHDLADVSV